MKTLTTIFALLTVSFSAFATNTVEVNVTHFSATKNFVEDKIERTVYSNDKVIYVRWSTSLESNNAQFILYRSIDGENWIEIATIAGFGEGSNTSVAGYEFEDNGYDTIQLKSDSFSDVVYYRLSCAGINNDVEVVLEQTSTASFLLPIELVQFQATVVRDNAIHLTWETATETNNDYFTLLQSFDGMNFFEVATVTGAGTSTEKNNYEFFDNILQLKSNPASIVYYQLQQTDYNGESNTSHIISVATHYESLTFEIQNLNTINGTMSLVFPAGKNNTVNIYNLEGTLVHSQSFAETTFATMYLPNLPKGSYVVECKTGSQKQNRKIRL